MWKDVSFYCTKNSVYTISGKRFMNTKAKRWILFNMFEAKDECMRWSTHSLKTVRSCNCRDCSYLMEINLPNWIIKLYNKQIIANQPYSIQTTRFDNEHGRILGWFPRIIMCLWEHFDLKRPVSPNFQAEFCSHFWSSQIGGQVSWLQTLMIAHHLYSLVNLKH